MADHHPHDPFRWLEEIESERALTWVRDHNAQAEAALTGGERFEAIRDEVRDVLDSSDKIPVVSAAGGYLYNFWRDEAHQRGVWRRTDWDSYRESQDAWETLLDVDELVERDGIDWVWHGASLLRTGPHAFTRALVALSRGGSDADETREFDLTTRRFIDPSDGGFFRAEAKGALRWIDADAVYCYTADDGDPTESGYPRRVRRWSRGQAVTQAPVVFEGEPTDLLVAASYDHTPGFERSWLVRATSFYTSQTYLCPSGSQNWVRIEVPEDAEVSAHREWLAVELREPWQRGARTHPAGALLVARVTDVLAGSADFEEVFVPDSHTALAGITWTRHHLILTTLHDVISRVEVLTPPEDRTGRWTRTPLADAPDLGSVGVARVDADDPELSDALWVTTTDLVTPTTLSLMQCSDVAGATSSVRLKQAPSHFDATQLRTEQRFATSADGTRVPYLVVYPDGVALDGSTPTLLYGYGGFEVSLTPSYLGAIGRAWLARGGAYAVANIRGGGEYGPAWHQAALRANRHRGYEDFAAVARDLMAMGLTSPTHLGMRGGSNGGLLAGNMLVNYPDLFGAIVIAVPLLDMSRYHRLLAGASWMAEYGDPDDPNDWDYLRTMSPYHLVKPQVTYPPVLLTTSTRDDRVHPGHARKMTALLESMGHQVWSYENTEGGHGGASTNAQAAHIAGITYEFLWQQLAKES